MRLKELRKQKGLTQVQCAEYLGIPVRTYQSYEANESKCPVLKYEFILQKLDAYGYTDETHGILTMAKIKDACNEVFQHHNVTYCYLFGSYAKGKATETSDVDLLIATDVSGLAFYEIVESLREILKKKVDLLNLSQLNNNPELLNEILKDGIKVYG